MPALLFFLAKTASFTFHLSLHVFIITDRKVFLGTYGQVGQGGDKSGLDLNPLLITIHWRVAFSNFSSFQIKKILNFLSSQRFLLSVFASQMALLGFFLPRLLTFFLSRNKSQSKSKKNYSHREREKEIVHGGVIKEIEEKPLKALWLGSEPMSRVFYPTGHGTVFEALRPSASSLVLAR